MFLPHRWDKNDPRRECIVNHVPSASLPFAMGARSCIGKKIALVQLTELVSQVMVVILFKRLTLAHPKNSTLSLPIPLTKVPVEMNITNPRLVLYLFTQTELIRRILIPIFRCAKFRVSKMKKNNPVTLIL